MTRVAIIGAGFGGLALGIRLQSAGIETTIVEARDKPGGRAYVWHDQGFTFDAGPTVITDPACLEELFALSGRKLADYVELMPISPFYRLLWEDGTRFDYVNDQAELDRQIAALNPGDVEGYRRFLEFSEAVYAEGYKRLGTVPFLKVSQMLAAAPELMRLQAWRSVYDKVAGYVRDDHLRQALSFHTLLVGGSPFAASSIYALIHALERDGGVWFPKGGTHALVRGLARLFEDLGGKLVVGDAARRIVTANGRVTGIVHADGTVEAFDAVASNADIVHTYDALLKDDARGPGRGQAPEAQAVQPVAVRGLLRPEGRASGAGAPHHLLRAALPGADRRDLRQGRPGRRLLALSAFAVGERSDPRPARMLGPLCALAGAAPGRRRHRLGRRGATLPRPDPGLPRRPRDPGAEGRPRDHAASSPRRISSAS